MIIVTGVFGTSPVVSSSEIKHLPLFRYEHGKQSKGELLRLYQMV